MGKYMKKPKPTGDNYTVAVSDLSPPSLGVRTRAKTLALQKLNSTTATPSFPEPKQRLELSYLQLRSRRLEKPQLTCCRRQNPNPRIGNCSGGDELVVSGLIETRVEELEECCYVGENNIDFDTREERNTRESTPCSLIKDINVITTPGSSTRARITEASNRINLNSVTRSMPLAQEIEEFFTRHEQEQQRRFADKYNFDIVNENPLEGCYEWVRVESQ